MVRPCSVADRPDERLLGARRLGGLERVLAVERLQHLADVILAVQAPAPSLLLAAGEDQKERAEQHAGGEARHRPTLPRSGEAVSRCRARARVVVAGVDVVAVVGRGERRAGAVGVEAEDQLGRASGRGAAAPEPAPCGRRGRRG